MATRLELVAPIDVVVVQDVCRLGENALASRFDFRVLAQLPPFAQWCQGRIQGPLWRKATRFFTVLVDGSKGARRASKTAAAILNQEKP